MPPSDLHTLNTGKVLEIQKAQAQQDGRKAQGIRIAQQLAATEANHARWRIFPRHLLESLASYLPANGAQVFDPANGDATASMVHGDVSLGNIMGYRNSYEAVWPDTTEVEDHPGEVPSSESPSSGGSGRSSPDGSSVQEGFRDTFTPTTLIDFGDGTLFGDPLVDIVSVFIAILNCERDRVLIDHLLDYWRSWTKGKGLSNTRTTLARRCMWHVLLWPSEGLSLHLVKCVPAIGEMSTWEQVEEAIFGWWSLL